MGLQRLELGAIHRTGRCVAGKEAFGTRPGCACHGAFQNQALMGASKTAWKSQRQVTEVLSRRGCQMRFIHHFLRRARFRPGSAFAVELRSFKDGISTTSFPRIRHSDGKDCLSPVRIGIDVGADSAMMLSPSLSQYQHVGEVFLVLAAFWSHSACLTYPSCDWFS